MGAPVVHVVDDQEQRCCQFFLTDALGTVRDVVDENGDVIRSMEFNEHGIPMPGSGAASGTFSPKTYQGALSVNDDRNDSGLYLMGHRHYAADLGRFISRDPIGFAGGLNLFGSHGVSPVMMVDPDGLKVPLKWDSPQALSSFLEMAGQASGLNLGVAPRGLGFILTIESSRPCGTGTPGARELLQNMVNGDTVIPIDLVYGDITIPFGAMKGVVDNHTIDLKDMENLNNNTGCPHQHGTGALQHELAEAYWMARGLDFRTPGYNGVDGAGAHGAGGRAEKRWYLESGYSNVGPVHPSPTSDPVAGWTFNYGQGHTVLAPPSWWRR